MFVLTKFTKDLYLRKGIMKELLRKQLRKYKLDELLKLISQLTINLYLNKRPLNEYHKTFYTGKFPRKITFTLSAFELLTLSYMAIQNTNDHLTSKIPNIDNIIELIYTQREYEELKRKQIERQLNASDNTDQILLGHMNEQLWFQDIVKYKELLYRYLRNSILLNIIPKKFHPKLDIDNEFIKHTGLDISVFTNHLFCLFFYLLSTNSTFKYQELIDKFKIVPNSISETNMSKCLNFFSEKYKYYYNDKNYNRLYYKPIVITDDNNYIISNAFVLAQKIYDGIYWIIRDIYLHKDSKVFMSEFGKYFESYVDLLLKFYLNDKSYERIVEDNINIRADWKIETKKYTIIIEQKAVQLKSNLKTRYLDLNEFDKYLGYFVKSYNQINKTIIDYKLENSNIIKLTLHYENIYLSESIVKKRLLKKLKLSQDDANHYYLIGIDEFELLMQVLSENEEIFNNIIEEKISIDKVERPHEDTSFKGIIHKLYEIKDVKFLESYYYLYDDVASSTIQV